MKRAVLCADDFGFNDPISNGILNLLAMGRLSATSCMTTMPGWYRHGPALRAQSAGVDVGLHINLTDGEHPMDLRRLLVKCRLGLLRRHHIEGALLEQLAGFIRVMGRPPDFIDGHQHVHHLPVVRDILLDWFEQTALTNRPYMRVTHPQGLRDLSFKQGVIAWSGGAGLKRRLQARHIEFNQSFAGIYSFRQAPRYAELFPQFLKRIDENGLIMCHPGLPSDDVSDGIRWSRPMEYEYLASDAFLQACDHAQVTFGPLIHARGFDD